jgi:Rv2258c-like winged HTH domain
MASRTRTRTKVSREAGREFPAAVNHAFVHVGEKFGLYGALAAIGPATAGQVAERTGVAGPQIAHWLRELAAADYLTYDKASGRFSVWCDISRN